MSFYTAKGDDGTTGLLGEGRVMKYDARIEAIGTVDESTAALGLARAQCLDPRSGGILLEAQRDLYKLMAEVAATPENAEKNKRMSYRKWSRCRRSLFCPATHWQARHFRWRVRSSAVPNAAWWKCSIQTDFRTLICNDI
jgi:cob(I)alamin adenosyltransferase